MEQLSEEIELYEEDGFRLEGDVKEIRGKINLNVPV